MVNCLHKPPILGTILRARSDNMSNYGKTTDNFLIKLLIIFGATFTVLVAALIVYNIVNEELDYDSFDHINAFSETMTQDEDEYLVYFYSEACGYCSQIKSNVLAFADDNEANMTIYLADTANMTGTNTIPNLTGTPGIVRVRNGIIVDVQTGTVPILSLFDSINAEAE
jgi:thioredoxin-related protein